MRAWNAESAGMFTIPPKATTLNRCRPERHFSICRRIGAVPNVMRTPVLSCQSMTSPRIEVSELVERFTTIHRERMQGLPIVNPVLEVEAVGFCDFESHELGILLSPWFMNLVLLPGSEEWSNTQQGDRLAHEFPSGHCEFTVCDDELLGRYLSAILFRTMSDFPDQDTARAVATEALALVLSEPVPERGHVSRRAMFTGIGGP